MIEFRPVPFREPDFQTLVSGLAGGSVLVRHLFICHAIEKSINNVLVTLREDETFSGATNDGGYIDLRVVQELARGANSNDRYAEATNPLRITQFTPSTLELGAGIRDLEWGQQVFLRIEVYNPTAAPGTPSWGRIAEVNGTLLLEDQSEPTEVTPDFLTDVIDS